MVEKTANLSLDIPPISWPLVESPFFEELLENYGLDKKTQELAKQFARDGYAIVDDLGIENIEAVADGIIEDLNPIYGDKGQVEEYWIYHDRIQDGWRFNRDVKSLATAPKILSLLKTFYQREPIPFQTLNFQKGTQQSTHSDIIHFSSMPLRFMCGVWIALEDIDVNNGPVHYYPGSHKLPIFDLNDLGIIGSYQNKPYQVYKIYEEFLQSLIEAKGLQKQELSIKKGQALIWAANLLHGGSPILDPKRTRHSQVTHYYFSDCMYYTPLLSDPFLHRIHLKKVINVKTGEAVPHIYNGEKIGVHPEQYEIERLQYQLLQTETELEKVRPKLLQYQDEVSRLRPQLKAVEEELGKLQPQMYQSLAEVEQLKPQVKLQEEELEKLRSHLYKSKSELEELRDRLKASQAEVGELGEDKKQAEAELEKLRSQQQKTEAEIEKLQLDVDRSGSQLEELQLQKEGAEKELEKLRPQLQAAEGELEKLRPQLQEAEGELEKLRPQLQAAEGELEKLRPQLNRAEGELEKLRPQLNRAEGELEKLRPQLNRAEGELEKLRPQLQATEGELENLRPQLQAAEGELEKLRPQLQAAEGELEKFQVKTEETNGQLKLLISQTLEANEELDLLRPRIRQTQAELDELGPRANRSEFLLEQYKSKVEGMESSKFWKLRNKWLNLKKMFGLPVE